MWFRKEISLENDYVDRMMYILFDANRPLTQDEITESVQKHYRVKMKPQKTIWHLDYAVDNGLMARQLLDEKTTYCPMISEEEFRKKQEERFRQRVQEGCFSDDFTNKFAPQKWTEEEYERIKKLIDELE